MPDFEQAVHDLNQARDASADARQKRDAARRKLQRLDAQITETKRQASNNNAGAQQALKKLEAARTEAAALFKTADAAHVTAEGALTNRYTDFVVFTDPTKFVSKLEDALPFLLFPVRVETRFKNSATGAGAQHELWVRIYPDDCLIDTFEPTLSGTEITAARRYYIESWKAGGIDAQERAAWRGLVSSVGARRAAWILQNFAPLNPGDKLSKGTADEIILVIAIDQPLPLPENLISKYWQAVWKAKGDAALLNAAFQDLANAPGSSVALARQVVHDFVPDNIRAWATSGETDTTVAIVQFPPYADLDTKNFSWTQPPRVNLFPDRFVFLGQTEGQPTLEAFFGPLQLPLTVGPDPTNAKQFIENDGDIEMGDDILWMTDFDAAVKKGLGLKVPLTPQQAVSGFERIFVVGVRLSANAEKNATDLEELFKHHLFSRSGFAIVPQGTPTNNTEEAASAYSKTDDADDSYDVFVNNAVQFTPTTDPLLKRDGQWFAEWLGLDPLAFQQVPNAGQADQAEARAMNTALWPATWGYYLERLLHPVVDDATIRRTRLFFVQHVSGRGPVPAVRIGRQPYGILPVTPFRRLGWITQLTRLTDKDGGYLMRLYQLLLQLDDLWRAMVGLVPQIGQEGDPDPQKTLLDILGLHPLAEEIHAVLGEPYNVSYNTVAFNAGGDEITLKQTPDAAGGQLLRDLGYDGEEIPDILSRNYFGRPFQLDKNLVDDVPPSETAAVRAYTPAPDNLNYLRWLLKKAEESVDDLRNEIGFTDNKKPNAVLYLFLRHALILAFDAAAREAGRVHVTAEVFQNWKRPQPFIHIATPRNNQPLESESPWARLYQDFPAVTGKTNYPMARHIVEHLATMSEAAEVRDVLAALEHLVDTPTAALERLFREHLDLCHYRLDAWKMGLLHHQLSFMRFTAKQDPAGSPGNGRRGVHLGAYGWLENVRPQMKELTPVTLDPKLAAIFNNKPKLPPLMRDSTNGGFVHAPSLNHAVTAAVLRNGYRANATPTQPDLMKVNLSSERVRHSLGLIEGIRNGQKLGALLGYQFERDLHDAGTGLDKFILELRGEFSLNAQKLKTTQTPNTPIEFIEANNVVDGFALMNFLDKHKAEADPLVAILPGSSAGERAAIVKAGKRLFDLADGVADVAMAESVHQVVMGNHERAAATMDAYAAAGLPPEPEVVRTPRSGHTLTHRVGIQLRPDVAANAGDNPRLQAEPCLNDWLSDHLPAPNDLGVVVRYNDPAGNPVRLFVTQADLGLAPLDLLFTIDEAHTQAAASLDDLVLRIAAAKPNVFPDTPIQLVFTEAEPNKITFFEAAPLLASLRALALRSRPLEATDVQIAGEASASKTGPLRLEKSRIDAVTLALDGLKTAATNFVGAVQPDAAADVLTNLDTHLAALGDLSAQTSLFSLPHTGFATAWQDRAATYGGIRDRLTKLTVSWTKNLADSRAITNGLPAPADTDMPQLEKAGRLVSTPVLPPDLLPPALRTEIVNRQNLFETKLIALTKILDAPPATLAAFHQQVSAELPLTQFDATEFKLDGETIAMQALLDRFVLSGQAIASEADRRLKTAAAKVTAHDAAGDPTQKVKLLQDAGKALLGDDFRMIPAFQVPLAVGSEWKNSHDASDSLLAYSKTRPDDPLPLPIDEWLHGAARVREKMFHFENVVLLSGAFGDTEPALRPVQLPFRAGEDWLALEFDPNNNANTLETERLLYTAHYSDAFDPAKWQCGLLVDEWTEVVPQKEEVTGLTFHFDRPNAEPPQAWLLATPASFTGEWKWDDLVAALNQTLDDARARAVEPDKLGQKFAALLPAALTESSWSPMTISANLIARAVRDFTPLEFLKVP
jgi:hypothetical protein